VNDGKVFCIKKLLADSLHIMFFPSHSRLHNLVVETTSLYNYRYRNIQVHGRILAEMNTVFVNVTKYSKHNKNDICRMHFYAFTIVAESATSALMRLTLEVRRWK
jgi:hypothetical protein